MNLTCGFGEIIHIIEDVYGLSASSDCSDQGSVCHVPGVGYTNVKRVCMGRRQCMFTQAEQKLCPPGERYTNYQQVKYGCIKGNFILYYHTSLEDRKP